MCMQKIISILDKNNMCMQKIISILDKNNAYSKLNKTYYQGRGGSCFWDKKTFSIGMTFL